MSDFTASQKDKLLAELRMVVADAEQMLQATVEQQGAPGAAEARGRLQERLQQARERIGQWQETAVERAKEAGKATDAYVHEHPWKAIGIAGAVGVLLGALISSRR
ncbi:MAG: hypothetical protein RLZZ584_547 [Pseudomonadota bacterium]|jgi:ElaB/YqjD/DUF883 family membrane-anchored ribosome-binding protein